MISPKCNKCSVTYVYDTMNQLSWVWSLHHRFDRPVAGTSTKGSMINRLQKKRTIFWTWENSPTNKLLFWSMLPFQSGICQLSSWCFTNSPAAPTNRASFPTHWETSSHRRCLKAEPSTAVTHFNLSDLGFLVGVPASSNLTYLAGCRPTNFPLTWDVDSSFFVLVWHKSDMLKKLPFAKHGNPEGK